MSGQRAIALLLASCCLLSCGKQEYCKSCSPGQLCVTTSSDVAGKPGTYQCHDMPTECAAEPTCECLARTRPGGTNLRMCIEDGHCEVGPNGALVHCRGG